MSWLFNTDALLGGFLLGLVQVLAALPWLRAVDPKGADRLRAEPGAVVSAVLTGLGVALLLGVFLAYKSGSSFLNFYGRVYASVLHLQLLIDLILVVPALLTLVWPKGGAVAQAAYREGWRQPMFWLVTAFGLLATWVAVVLPYFTFGDDYKMMKQIGFDVIMLSAVLFGVLTASISISEEIEGRTAITLLSKPVNRRQFLVGKFLGIIMAAGTMSLVLAWNMNWALFVFPFYDEINRDRVVAAETMSRSAVDRVAPALMKAVPNGPAVPVAEGAGAWIGETFAHSFGVLLGFGQVMVLVAVATALATRVPFVVNLVLCLVIYFLGHLAPVVVKVTDKTADTGGAGVGLVRFLGNMFDTLLPSLEFFNMGPAIIRETPLDLLPFAGYVATVFGYAVLYTVIALLVGLLMFEDRDLA